MFLTDIAMYRIQYSSDEGGPYSSDEENYGKHLNNVNVSDVTLISL